MISLLETPMYRFLDALEDKEVNLSRYRLFILIISYNDLELDMLFLDLYYKQVIDTLQHQSLCVKFVVSTLVTDIALYASTIHSKNVLIKQINELSDRIFLFNVWKKFHILNLIQPEFVRCNKLTPTGAKLLIKFFGHKFLASLDYCNCILLLCCNIQILLYVTIGWTYMKFHYYLELILYSALFDT